MPVEIRELHIKVQVDSAAETVSDQAGKRERQLAREEIVKDCVEQVLRVLDQKKKR